MRGLEDYRKIVGDEIINGILRRVRKLYGKHILHINSTYQGGGVAEILNSLVPLMNDIGLDAGWRILHGNPDFFTVTKKFHNALQGEPIRFTDMKRRLYIQANENFSTYTHIDHDCVIIHDPQPLPLIGFYKKRQPWIWRCHIDITHPNEEAWEFIKTFALRYDLVIVSNEQYKKKDLPVEQRIIFPAIDPLSPKNIEISDRLISKNLSKFNISTDKPLLTQISRFDKWKDPEGVLEVFKLVKEEVDCRLVLCGNTATDDPEGREIYESTERKAKPLIKRGEVIMVGEPASSNFIFINALQRQSSVMMQKSIREGFALTVTESMWKETPVVGSNIGGIPLQIEDGENGFLVEPTDIKGAAERVVNLLQEPKLAEEMGKRAKEKIRKNFLVTRMLIDYLDLFNMMLR
jgi:trehalose synthase